MSEKKCRFGMSLDDYVTRGGYVYNNTEHDTAVSLLQVGVLGFCGCGLPESNLLYVLGGLELIDESEPAGFDAFSDWIKGHRRRELRHFRSLEAAYFFYYWADKEGLSEHGVGMPGWLTDEGANLMAMLREWRAANVGEAGNRQNGGEK